MRIRFTSHAMQDLDDLKEWLRSKNPRGYNSVATQISKTIRPVAEHPQMGRKTLRDDIRELVGASLWLHNSLYRPRRHYLHTAYL
ncbi:type II toxin-antitoxin system RelE/ParE family toxin [Pararhizobium sp. LjRoot238]|uniref:type II toxin-antitoxin system RelE/ParE family toxin n=1 Tax=Pararhizobium sp. LjRoot238 TaxID=3342293 RepID=UPI003F4F41C6